MCLSQSMTSYNITDGEKRRLSQQLRTYLYHYNNYKQSGDISRSLTYLPSIRHNCEMLGLDWKVIAQLENGYVFLDDKPNISVTTDNPITVKKPQITVASVYNGIDNCKFCGKPLLKKRKGARFCNSICKSNFHTLNK